MNTKEPQAASSRKTPAIVLSGPDSMAAFTPVERDGACQHVVDSHAEPIPRVHSHQYGRNLEVAVMHWIRSEVLGPGQTLSGKSAVRYEHVAWAQTLKPRPAAEQLAEIQCHLELAGHLPLVQGANIEILMYHVRKGSTIHAVRRNSVQDQQSLHEPLLCPTARNLWSVLRMGTSRNPSSGCLGRPGPIMLVQ